jgi:hypothetical protein
MTNKEWIEKIEENQDEILEKVGEALRQAYEYSTGIIEVVLTEDRKVAMGRHISENETDGEVWNGTAIPLVRFNASDFNITDSFYDMEEFNVRSLLKQFNAEYYLDDFIEMNGNYNEIEFYYSLPDDIREKIDQEIIENEIEYYFEINDVIENIISNLEQEEF